MSKLDKTQLMDDLKALIIEECDKQEEFSPDDITENEPLVGESTKLGLDSLDTLQLSRAILKQYSVRIEGSKDGRSAFTSVSAMAGYILAATQ